MQDTHSFLKILFLSPKLDRRFEIIFLANGFNCSPKDSIKWENKSIINLTNFLFESINFSIIKLIKSCSPLIDI